VHQDIDEFAERIAHIEAANAPGLIGRPIFDRKSRLLHPRERGIDIIHLDGEIGRRRVGAALRGHADLDAHAFLRAVCHEPAVIHQEIEPKQILIETLGRSHVPCIDVGDDAFDFHGR
jgi:hypothetical protein